VFRILHIISTLERTGTAKQLALLATGLDQTEFEVHVCALARGDGYAQLLREAGIPTWVLGNRWRFDPLAFGRLHSHIRRVRPDLVHVWHSRGGPSGRVAAWLAGVPHLVTSERTVHRRKSGTRWAIDRRLARVADRLVANSRAVRDIGIEHGLPAEKLTVIANGVPPAARSDVSREELLRELNLPAGARLIGVIGPHVPHKRTTDLVWAADLLRVLDDNMRLLVMGDGPQRSQLERFARLASDLDHIRFLGQRDDLWRIVPHLDVLWHGSSSEGQPNAVMEAMAAGVPVVASDIPAHRELIEDGQSGLLVPVAARAARVRVTDQLLNDASLAGRLGAAARARMAEHFTVERMVEKYAELYRDVATEGA
jgi:glycosyltransferase involved in cell wall biosynthesis